MTAKRLFGSAIALVLIVVYAYLIVTAGRAAACTPQPACGPDFNDSMASAMALIGGLIAALVVAVLTETRPGEAPGRGVLRDTASERLVMITTIVTGGYLAVWIVTGLFAFLMGVKHPGAVPALDTLGQSWLGIAVAAGYSYFGIER